MTHDDCCGAHGPLLHRLLGGAVRELTRRDVLAGAAAAATLATIAPWARAEPPAGAAGPAEAIYHGGPILTMVRDGARVEAIAVRRGTIVHAGGLAEAMALKGERTTVIDLEGRCLMPGFIDPHSHLVGQSMKSAVVNLDPKPIGEVATVADIQRLLRESIQRTKPEVGAWVIGWGYDDTGIAEMRHPTRDDLDAVSTDHPILLLHISGHLLTGNSKMLELAGVGPDTADPAGGKIQRRAGSQEPNGVLEENAMALALPKVKAPKLEQALEVLAKGVAAYAAAGITTAQEGAAMPGGLRLLRAMEAAGRLPIDVVAYPIYMGATHATLEEIAAERGSTKALRLGGLKLIVDGSIQGYTGFLTKPYYVPPGGKSVAPDKCGDGCAERLLHPEEATPRGAPVPTAAEGHRGYANMKQDELTDWLRRCDAVGIPVLAHANGDAAIDMLLDAVETVRKDKPRPDLRTTIIHAQTMREDQLDRAAKHGLIPSFFPIHIYFWGDRHRDVFLGPDRAARISPARTALDRGMKVTLHHDAPVAGIEMLKVAWTSVNRVTTSGKDLGPEQRISAFEALRAITADAAYQYFEETRKGTVEAGKLADLVILSEDPLANPKGMKDIRVLETIKAGRTVFKSPA